MKTFNYIYNMKATIKHPKPISSATYQPKAQHNEPGGGTSETVPHQVLDLRTLVARNQQGIDVPMHNNGGYSDEDFPDLHQMDHLEILQMRIDNQEHIEELKRLEHQYAKELEQRLKETPGKDEIIEEQKPIDEVEKP